MPLDVVLDRVLHASHRVRSQHAHDGFRCGGISATDFVISYIATDDNPADGGTKALDRYKQALSAMRLLGKSEATTKAV